MIRGLRARWRWLWRRSGVERELNLELEHHLLRQTEKHLAAGASPEAARRLAAAELGGRDDIAEQEREATGLGSIESVARDLRFALRLARRAPGLTAIVVLTLALGIGANTAIFSVLNAALLRNLPVPHPEQLVQLLTTVPGQAAPNDTFATHFVQQLRLRRQTVAGVAAFRRGPDWNVAFNGYGEMTKGEVVSGDYFSTLEIKPELGREFSLADEGAPGQNPVAVISDAYWHSRFGAAPHIVGLRITINNALFTIIGVTAPGFFGLQEGSRADVYVPMTMVGSVWPSLAVLNTPYNILSAAFRGWLTVVVRLQPGVAADAAGVQLQPAFHASMLDAVTSLAGLPFDSPAARRTYLDSSLLVRPGGAGLDALRKTFSRPLWILMALVALLLLLACANVANLLLARAQSREREMALRVALGAGRGRLLRQLLIESLLLAVAGGALGVLLAYWGGPTLVRLASRSSAPVLLDTRPDLHALGFVGLVALLATLLFGLLPALRITDRKQSHSMAPQTSAAISQRLGNGLAIFQVALALLLLVGAGLLVRTLQNLERMDPGFNPRHVLLLSADPGVIGINRGDAALIQLHTQLLDRFRALPGVVSASLSVHNPLDPRGSSTQVNVRGFKLSPAMARTPIGVEVAGPAYFQTMQTPLLLGRDFTAADRPGAAKVVVVNHAFSRMFFGDSNPIGRQINIPGYRGDSSWLSIVGVAADVKVHDLRETTSPMVYVSFLQYPESGVTFEVRTAGDVSPAAVRGAARAVNPRLPLFAIHSLEQQLGDSIVQERLVATLAGLFAVLALLLACLGLYGLMGYSVSRRTREIGVRMALGARRAQVAGQILGEGARLAFAGMAIGIPLACAAALAMGSQLYGISAFDPLTLAASALLLLLVAIAACLMPARRAMRADPMTALRCD